MTSYEEEIKKSAERFFRETAHHRMEVLHNDGLYRHLRFRDPRRGYGSMWFDLITWPGNLVFRGDGESYAFARTTDMFEFFAHELYKDGSVHINPQYWAEKLTSHDQSQVYDMDTFREELDKQAQYLIDDGSIIDKDQVERFKREVEGLLEDEDYSTMEAALRMMDDFSFFNNEDHAYSSRHIGEAIRFEDSWEWVRSCQVYQWWYLWACHGIVWGIKQYYAMFGRPEGYDERGHTQDVARRGVPVG